jgi:hypothetical protein
MLFYPEARANTCFLEISVVTKIFQKSMCCYISCMSIVDLERVHSKMCTFWFRIKKGFFKIWTSVPLKYVSDGLVRNLAQAD